MTNTTMTRENQTAAADEQQIAVLKRLREMLRRQREKFQSYLTLLEEEEHAIHRGDAESLLAQVEMEKTIIADIHSLRKVIEPLESLYQSAYPRAEETVPRLKATLDRMGEQVAAHNAKNRALLRERMEELRVEIASLRAWPKERPRFTEAAPRLVDITT